VADFFNTLDVGSVSASGTVGAPYPGRWVGATTSGAPTSGTYVIGDWVYDRCTPARVYVCTAGGTPGTWVCASGLQPEDYGLLGMSGAPDAFSTATAWTQGQLRAALLRVPSGESINTLVAAVSSAGVGLTAGQCYLCVWHPTTRALLSTSGDLSAAFGSTGTKEVSVPGTPAGLTELWVGGWFNAATSRPGLFEVTYNVASNLGATRTSLVGGAYTSAPPDPMPLSIANNRPWFGVKRV